VDQRVVRARRRVQLVWHRRQEQQRHREEVEREERVRESPPPRAHHHRRALPEIDRITIDVSHEAAASAALRRPPHPQHELATRLSDRG
jgi:hypothetical protein